MTLLMTCTNRLCFIFKAQIALVYTLTIILSLVLLQGCSSITGNINEKSSDTEKQTPETLEALSKGITDLVDIPNKNGELSTDTNGMIEAANSKRNGYLDQKQQRLANIPSYVITKYKQALTLMTNQEWRKAELLFDEILVIQPQLSGAYVNKALIAIEQKDLSGASDQLDKALEVNVMNPYAYQMKGLVARLTGDFEQAEKSYLKALDIWPEYPEAQVNLAILLELYRGRLLDARKYYSSYLELQADDQQVQRWLAGVEIKIKRAGLMLPEKPEKNNQNIPLNVQSKKAEEG
jgi:tetratricopeptide (TPR) repeat protein